MGRELGWPRPAWLFGTNAPRMLSPGGMLLIVHSVVCEVKTTVNILHQGGLKAAGVARREDLFGPVMLQQIALPERRDLIELDQRHEELVVIRGDRIAPHP
jgi:release factor glutamine methyltransferase